MKYKKIESPKILETAIYFMIKTICFRFTMNYNPRSILPYNSKESDIFMVSSTHIYIVQCSLVGAYFRAVQLFIINIFYWYFYIKHETSIKTIPWEMFALRSVKRRKIFHHTILYKYRGKQVVLIAVCIHTYISEFLYHWFQIYEKGYVLKERAGIVSVNISLKKDWEVLGGGGVIEGYCLYMYRY